MRSVKFRSKEEIQTHLSSQRSNGLTDKDYCTKNNIPISTFRYWRKRYSETVKESSPSSSFARVTMSNPSSLLYEIISKDIKIRVPVSVDKSILRDLFTVLHGQS